MAKSLDGPYVRFTDHAAAMAAKDAENAKLRADLKHAASDTDGDWCCAAIADENAELRRQLAARQLTDEQLASIAREEEPQL